MDDGGCGGWSGSETQESCDAKAGCSWSTSLKYCYGDNYSYFAGTGIGIRSSTDVTIYNNEVHHCTGSGIRADTSDNITINSNLVYGNIWWTTSASSAIVIAEAQGTGVSNLTNNVVYGNRNFMPFFMTSMPTGGGEVKKNYGGWNQDYIIDGQGVYITRNQDYKGTMNLNNNVSFDNGINGLVVHRTTNDAVTVNVKNNEVFDNGRTTTDVEGR